MVRIVTTACPACGTVVAGNVLAVRREMTCPGLGCDRILRFSDLDAEDRQHILANPDRYGLEDRR